MASFQWKLVFWLGIIWTVSILYGEMGIYWHKSMTYDWPKIKHNGGDSNASNGNSKISKVAIIASPKVSAYFLGKDDSFSLFKIFQNFFSNLYMKRTYQSFIFHSFPDYIFILGDLFENAYSLSYHDYVHTYFRFKHVFYDSKKFSSFFRSKWLRKEKFRIFFIPGKNDLGFNKSEEIRRNATERYNRIFRNLKFSFPIGQFRFIAFDSYAYADLYNDIIDLSKIEEHNAINFVQQTFSNEDDFISNNENNNTIFSNVLISQIHPFSNNQNLCENLKQSIFSPMESQKYLSNANYDKLSDSNSKLLIKSFKPFYIISNFGKPCLQNESNDEFNWKKISPGDFSRSFQNSKSSFSLLSVSSSLSSSLSSSSSSSSSNSKVLENENISSLISSKVCYGPSMTIIHIWYTLLFLFSYFSLVYWQRLKASSFTNLALSFMNRTSTFFQNLTTRIKLKGEEDEEGGEMDMMFDAEGNMILIKSSRPSILSKQHHRHHRESSSSTATSRGTVQTRPSAGKKTTEAFSQTEPKPVDLEGQPHIQVVKPDLTFQAAKTPVQGFKGRRSFLEANLAAMGPLCVLVGIELTLYVGLIAKDWT